MLPGVEYDLIPAVKDPANRRVSKVTKPRGKAWLHGELIVRAERQELTSLPAELFYKTTVRELIFSYNSLETLPPQISCFTQLQLLKLDHNLLTELPLEVCSLTQLKHLDVSYNKLETLPLQLCRLLQLSVLNLNGNPLSASVQEGRKEPLSAIWQYGKSSSSRSGRKDMPAELETARPGSSAGPDGSGSKPGTAPSLRSLQQQTKVMMEYLTGLLSSEDALAVKQQRLVLTRQATRAKIKSMVTHADTAMLELCLQAAKDAELPQEDVDRVIAAVASAQALREAVTSEVKADVAAAVRHWEELCKPNGPACGPLYEDARMLLRRLTKQELERGWRCSSPFSGTASTPAADAGADPGTATSSPRNEQSVRAAGEQAPRASSTGRALSPYKSWAELKHEQLMQQGAQTYEDWLAQKQEQDQQAQLQLRDKRLKERRQQLQKVTCSADMALTKLQQERQWPSRTLDAYPPGTFAVSPDRIRATKETYKRTFAGQLPASRSADLAVRGDASFSSRHEAVYAAQISSPADAEHAPETAAAPAED